MHQNCSDGGISGDEGSGDTVGERIAPGGGVEARTTANAVTRTAPPTCVEVSNTPEVTPRISGEAPPMVCSVKEIKAAVSPTPMSR